MDVWQVLLLDEITVDLDVVARMDLLSFFVDECEEVRHRLQFHFRFPVCGLVLKIIVVVLNISSSSAHSMTTLSVVFRNYSSIYFLVF